MSPATLLLRSGLVVDGLGSPAAVGDVLVQGGRVAAVGGTIEPPAGAEVVDARGRVVCPGFVDIHTHSDLTLLSNPDGHSKVRQGVTTEVVGNCGLGLAPLAPDVDLHTVREAVGYLDLDPAVAVTWRDVGAYLDVLAAAGPTPNVAAFAAHLPIRASVLGLDDVDPDPHQLDRMTAMLDEALEQGAVGFSTGLVYAPLCFAPHRELVAFGARVAAHDRLFAWHVRDYADGLLASVTQALDVARATGCRTQISHLVSVGRRNWGTVRHALEAVDEARGEGLDVGVDIYPYLAGNAPLSQRLPSWAQAGGPDRMRAVAADPATRARIRAEWAAPPGSEVGPEEIVVNWLPDDGDQSLVGHSLAALAESLSRSADDVLLDLVADYGASVLMVAGGRSEQDLRDVLTHPAAVVASDGQALDPHGPTGAGLPHPRCYGTFPRYLSGFGSGFGPGLVDDIRRCTSAAADRVGLRDRGRLEVGAPADLLVLDPETLADTATFQAPHQYPTGVDLVVVAGRVVVDHGRTTGARPGRLLRAES